MSSALVIEGDLSFEFDENWKAILQWDKHPAYQNGIKQLDRSKAVDIIGMCADDSIVFFEIKDYRFSNREKPISLWIELELKVRNTVAGLFGAGRRPQYASDCAPILKSLLKPHELKLVFWIEQPRASGKLDVLRKRHVVAAGTAMKKVVEYVKWLDARVIHVSQEEDYARLVPGLKVVNLSRKRRQLAEAIVQTLQTRGVDLDEAVRDRISRHLVIRDLEKWLERATEVSTVEELFGGGR
jgi:hypothetical protein